MAREQFQTLTEPMYYILIALSEECCGVDIMEKVQKISGGRVKVGPGTLYTMLSKFEENQIIFRTKEEGRRKSYVITEQMCIRDRPCLVKNTEMWYELSIWETTLLNSVEELT